MALRVERVTSRQDLKRFLRLPWMIYREDPHWVPPLLYDRKKLLDTSSHPFWKHGTRELFLAFSGDDLVGRIAAIYDPRYKETYGDDVGYFGFFEAIDDKNVAQELFDTVERWLRSVGAESVLGPLQPSLNDEAGLLVEGFDDPPQALMPYNPEYYRSLIESCGYAKSKDLYAWKLTREFLTDKLKRVRTLVMERENISIRNFHFSPKKDFKEDVQRLKELYNTAWASNWGNVRMSAEEVEAMADDLKLVAEKDLVLVAEKDGEAIGFVLALPDINQLLIKNRSGALLPGLVRLLTQKKSVTRGRILALGLLPHYQKRGIDAALYYEIGVRMTGPHGYTESEASWILDDNHAMNNALQMMKGERYKTYRLYSKTINEN